MKRVALIAVLVTLALLRTAETRAQAPAIQWQKCLGGSSDDRSYSFIRASDGGFVIAGWTSSNDGDVSGNHGGLADAWIVKLTATGSIQWQKCFGGTGDDYAESIVQTSDGGFAVAGETSSNDGNVSGNHGGLGDAWVVKLSATGAI